MVIINKKERSVLYANTDPGRTDTSRFRERNGYVCGTRGKAITGISSSAGARSIS